VSDREAALMADDLQIRFRPLALDDLALLQARSNPRSEFVDRD
jgi:hypothetical protein